MIRECSPDEFPELITEAKAAQLTLCNGLLLYVLIINGETVGVCGLKITGTTGLFKFEYVRPEHRRKGYLSKMIEYRMFIAKAQGVKTITANCTPMSISTHIKNGAKVVTEYKYGGKKVRYEVI